MSYKLVMLMCHLHVSQMKGLRKRYLRVPEGTQVRLRKYFFGGIGTFAEALWGCWEGAVLAGKYSKKCESARLYYSTIVLVI